jgi:hypothetical protein
VQDSLKSRKLKAEGKKLEGFKAVFFALFWLAKSDQ